MLHWYTITPVIGFGCFVCKISFNKYSLWSKFYPKYYLNNLSPLKEILALIFSIKSKGWNTYHVLWLFSLCVHFVQVYSYLSLGKSTCIWMFFFCLLKNKHIFNDIVLSWILCIIKTAASRNHQNDSLLTCVDLANMTVPMPKF